MKLDVIRLLDLLPVNIYAKSIDGVFIYGNTAQANFFRVDSPNDLIGKKESDFLTYKDETPPHRLNDYKVIELDKACFFEETNFFYGAEVSMLSVKMPLKNEAGECIGVFGISSNLAEQKMRLRGLQKELAYTEATLRNIVSALPGHVYWLDDKSVIQGCNKQQAVSLGLNSPEELVGKRVRDVMPEDQAKEHEKINKEVMQTGKEFSVEEVTTLANGRVRTFISKKVPLRSQGSDIDGMLGMSLDITALKEAQEKVEASLTLAREAENKRKQFLENQEHDIVTAVAGVQYAAMRIEYSEGKSMTEIKESAKEIGVCAQRLQDYNESLLRDLAWLEDKGRIIPNRANLKKIVSEIYDLNLLAAKHKSLDFQVHFDESIPKFVIADELIIFQCLQNLVANAIKFTQTGFVELRVKLLEEKNSGILVISFKVIDSGRGIEKEHQRYVFDEYYKVLPSNQIDPYTGQGAFEDKGRGLGLTLSQKHAKAMKGELVLYWSEPGKGSEFGLTLPLTPALDQVSK